MTFKKCDQEGAILRGVTMKAHCGDGQQQAEPNRREERDTAIRIHRNSSEGAGLEREVDIRGCGVIRGCPLQMGMDTLFNIDEKTSTLVAINTSRNNQQYHR